MIKIILAIMENCIDFVRFDPSRTIEKETRAAWSVPTASKPGGAPDHIFWHDCRFPGRNDKACRMMGLNFCASLLKRLRLQGNGSRRRRPSMGLLRIPRMCTFQGSGRRCPKLTTIKPGWRCRERFLSPNKIEIQNSISHWIRPGAQVLMLT